VVDSLPDDAREPGLVLDPILSGDVFHTIRRRIEILANETAQQHDSYGWLWYTRRLPVDVFEGHLSTTASYDWLLAEALSASSSTAVDYETHDGQVAYPLTVEALEPVARLVLARSISHTHSMIRRAAKGISFRSNPAGMPEPIPNLELDAAISNYDTRVAEDRAGLHAGTRVLSFDPSELGFVPLLAVAAVKDFVFKEVRGWIGPLEAALDDRQRLVRTMGRFLPLSCDWTKSLTSSRCPEDEAEPGGMMSSRRSSFCSSA
jgi:hypothetical protein